MSRFMSGWWGDPIFRQTPKYLKHLHSHDNQKNPERAECKCTWARSKSKWNGSEVYFVPGARRPLWGHPTPKSPMAIPSHDIPSLPCQRFQNHGPLHSQRRNQHPWRGDCGIDTPFETYCSGRLIIRPQSFTVFHHFPHWNSHMFVFVPQ